MLARFPGSARRLLLAAFMFFLFAAVAEARSWKPKFSNSLTLLPSYSFEDVGQGTAQWSTVIRDEPQFSLRPRRNLKFNLAPVLFSDPSSLSQGEKFILDFNEAGLETFFGNWAVKAGVNTVSWGVTDVFNPLDVVSSRRYMDPLNSEKRGVPSVDITWDNGVWRAEGIYIPVQLESILPGENSRWLPRDIAFNRGDEFGKLILANRFKYVYTGKEVVDNALANGFGFRFERRGSGLDLTGIFYQGAPTAPAIFTPDVVGTTISLNPTVVIAEEITLQPIYYLRRTAGVGAVWTLESTIVRAAAANSDRVTRQSDLPGWSHSAVLGVEHNIPVAQSTLTVLVQATYAQHEDQAENSVTSLERIFDRSWLVGARLSTSSDWTLNVAALFDTLYDGKYALVKGEHKITDGFNGSIQVDLLDGPSGTPLGTYRRNDRVILGLSFLF